jgi:hypothetical protein
MEANFISFCFVNLEPVLLIGGNEGNIYTRNPSTNQHGPICGESFSVKEVNLFRS